MCVFIRVCIGERVNSYYYFFISFSSICVSSHLHFNSGIERSVRLIEFLLVNEWRCTLKFNASHFVNSSFFSS